MKQNPPQKHHYIPVFYLKRWAGADGQICQFSKPNGRVVPNRRHPERTGFVKRLYTVDVLPAETAQVLEDSFFKPVDSGAADALKLMEQEGNRAVWDSRRRSAWSRFIHSLLLRCPEDLECFKKVWRYQMYSDPTGEWEQRYQHIRKPDDAPTFEEAIAEIPPESMAKGMIESLMSIIDSANSGEALNQMRWYVLNTDSARFDLLTSDRPIRRTNGLNSENGHLALPIGPRRLFVAAKDQHVLRKILNTETDSLVREVNRQIVSHAVRYVYSTDDRQRRFVENQMSTAQETRLMENMLRRKEEVLKAALYYDEETMGADLAAE